MSKFAPIHIISGYSFLKSGLTIKKIEMAIKNNDYFAMGLTDINVMHGFPQFAHLMVNNQKPYILGLSLTVEEESLVVYAINDDGYKNLIELSLVAQKEELDFSFLKEHNSGLAGVLETKYGKFFETFSSIEEVDTSFTKYLLNISNIFPNNFYLGIEVTSKDDVKYANKVRKFADKYTYDCVALPRVRYLKKDDAIVLNIVEAISNNEKCNIKANVGQEYFLKESDYHKIYSEVEIDNTNKIVALNTFDLLQKRGTLLHYPCENSDEELEKMATTSLNELGLGDDEKYTKRLAYELEVIKTMGYSDYFLLVQDYVSWAKQQDILVGLRGSAAGSLIAYLLHISDIDPLQYDLLFERFLNPNRVSMPDIDVDFMDNRRDEVIQHMRDKYGSHRVCNIVTFQTIGAKQALRDIGRIYQIPERHISLLSKSITEKSTLGYAYKNDEEFKKLCDSDQYFKEIVSLAGKIEGLPRQSSLHAAGIILNDVDINLAMPVSNDLNDDFISQYEGIYLEELGFLKMDFLGIRYLTTISYCVDLINQNHPEAHLDKFNIPFNEPAIFDLIKSGQVLGLFQVSTPMMRRSIQTLKPNCFDDVVALLAFNRPGPKDNLAVYARRRDGKEKVTYISDDLKNILSSTYGIILYQEQISQIAHQIAGMSLGESDLFRRAISKKDINIINAQKAKFIQGCLSKGYDEKTANDIFDHISKFADYGFNKSHSVTYALLTCRMAYLKAHYPLEYYSAVLQTGSSGETKLNETLSEMKKRGIKVLPPDINNSSLMYQVHDNCLLFPLTAIHGLNTMICSNIVNEREKGPFTDFFNFVTRMFAYKINEEQLLALINSGALDSLYSSRASMRLTVKASLQYAELSYSSDGQMNLGIPTIAPPSMNKDEDNPMENLRLENEALSVVLSSSPLEYRKEQIAKYNVTPIGELSHFGVVKTVGIAKDVRIIKTKKGEQMAVLTIYDETDELEVVIFPRVFDLVKGFLVKNVILIVTGRFEKRDELSFLADNIERLED